MKKCRICENESILMTEPVSGDHFSYYVYYVRCSSCGIGTNRFKADSGNESEAIDSAVNQWEVMN